MTLKFAAIGTALAALSVSACVIVDPLPVTGPSVNGVPTVAPSVTLASQLGGRAFVNIQTGETLNLWSDGSYTVGLLNGGQAFGTWRAPIDTATMCFTGPVAAYARGACIPIRYDGDYLSLFDASQRQEMEAYAVQ